jgi:hypothetical protein
MRRIFGVDDREDRRSHPRRPSCYGGLSGHLHFGFVTSWPLNAAITGEMLKAASGHTLAVVMSIAGGGSSLERQ